LRTIDWWFQRSRQERILLDWLGREFRIDAGGAEKNETIHAGSVRAMNDVRLNSEIIVDEISRIGAIG
jgi:hypothetical protein